MKRVLRLAPILVVAATGSMAMTAQAGHVAPQFVSGNPDCGVAPGTTELVKFEPIRDGVTSANGVTITVSGSSFSWSSTVGIDAVIVKGGPNANVYFYDEATSDSGLTAPLNEDGSGGPYGLSHITFCVDPGPPPPPPTPTCEDNPPPEGCNPQTTKTQTPTTTQTPTPTTTTPAQGGVLPDAVVSGRAGIRLRGRCRARTNRAVVSGRQIARVEFILDGRTRKVVRPAGGTRATYRVPLARIAVGTHRLQARVTFRAESQTDPRTLRIPVARCARRQIQPQFTG